MFSTCKNARASGSFPALILGARDAHLVFCLATTPVTLPSLPSVNNDMGFEFQIIFGTGILDRSEAVHPAASRVESASEPLFLTERDVTSDKGRY